MHINQHFNVPPFRIIELEAGLGMYVENANGINCSVFNDMGRTLTCDIDEALALLEIANKNKDKK